MSDLSKVKFASLLAKPEDDLNLAEAALLIASDAYPGLDARGYLGRLDGLASAIGGRVGATAGPVEILREMNRYLFTEQGFAGNLDDYSDPRNSYLNEVLDRRLGIPITLSIVYIEVGWRLGLPLQGVSFPGHFLVKLPHGDGVVVLDPFYHGVSLSVEELRSRIQQVLGEEASDDRQLARYLVGATKKDILMRVLRNLKLIHLDREHFELVLNVLDRMLLLTPHDADVLRERAALYRRLECHRSALADYVRYLRMAPDAPDIEQVRGHIIDLQEHAARLN